MCKLLTIGWTLGMMLAMLTTLACGAEEDAYTTVERFASQINYDGTYAYDVALSNGVEQKESGFGGQYAIGSYQYYSPEGIPVQVSYTADENGYRPESDVLPTPPPIPDYILRAIEYIRTNPTPEELADQQLRATQF